VFNADIMVLQAYSLFNIDVHNLQFDAPYNNLQHYILSTKYSNV
jgi:hypothetical protein